MPLNELERMIAERKAGIMRDQVIADVGLGESSATTLMIVAAQLLVYAFGQIVVFQGNEAALRQLMALQIDVFSSVMRSLPRLSRVAES